MYITNLIIENFRCFGGGKDKLKLPLLRGLNTLVGENDAGKTAIIDALRMLLGTRDQETIKPQLSDFYYISSTRQADSLSIEVVLSDLSVSERANFAEYLTYQSDNEEEPVALRLTLRASLRNDKVRTVVYAGFNNGSSGLKELDSETRECIRAAYLRPLRDAEKEMDVGRNSRISKILRKQADIDEGEKEINLANIAEEKFNEVIDRLGIVGVARLINELLERQPAINTTAENLNDNFLQPLEMNGDNLSARLGIGPDADDETLKRQMLEKIGITLEGEGGKRGLGSNNLLYIACEMLLLSDSRDELALLIVEEPEAHLHPQRQLKLIRYLQERIDVHRNRHDMDLQIILSTHSPTLASKLSIGSMSIIHRGKALPLSAMQLADSNLTFLERFIDATKSNLFFCRGLMIVEGDAENLILPSLSKLMGVDFTETGVSIVNVGHTGLSYYANLFSGTKIYPNPGIKVACLHDLDLIEYPVAKELGLNSVCGSDESEIETAWTDASKERNTPDFEGKLSWLHEQLPSKIISGLPADRYDQEKIKKVLDSRSYEGSCVEGFYTSPWTFEYSLAFHGLGKEMTIAACLAKAEKSASYNPEKFELIKESASEYYKYLEKEFNEPSLVAGKVYELFLRPVSISEVLDDEEGADIIRKGKASKAAASQHLGVLLEKIDSEMNKSGKTAQERVEYWKSVLPETLVDAIHHAIPTNAVEGAKE